MQEIRMLLLKAIGLFVLGMLAIAVIAAIFVGIGILLEEPAKKFYEWIFSKVRPETKEWIEEKFIGLFLTLWLLLILYFMAG